MKRERCQTCRYASEESGAMICRRRSPAPAQKDGWSERYKIAVWPEVESSDWCGEWAEAMEMSS